MNLRIFALSLSALVAAAGCLPDDPEVQGNLLYPGTNVENPSFADYSQFGGEPWVFFQVRRRRQERPLSGMVDLHRVHFVDGREQLVVAGVSERPEWGNHDTDADGLSYYMIDERVDEARGRAVGTLARVSMSDGVVDTLPDVLGYTMHYTRKLFMYRKHVPDMKWPELHLRFVSGEDRNLGPVSGQVQFVGENKLYFISGDDSTMMRMVGFDSEPLALRSKVSRFELQYQEKLAIVTLSEKGQVHTVVLDLDTLAERPFPVDNPCCWHGLRGNVAVFAEAATDSAPARLHSYDIVTEKHDVIDMPPPMVDVRSIISRPQTGETLLTDTENKHLAIMRPGPPRTVEVLPLSEPDAFAFTADGKRLVYIEADPAPPPPAMIFSRSGRLMVQDADDWYQPPRTLTPPGTSCLVDPRGYLLPPERPTQVIFWARYGLGASDLYLTDLDTEQTLRLAVGIGAVAIGGRNVLGVVRINQDLTGDLVHRDFLTGEEQIIEHSVAAATTRDDPTYGPIVAFVVRERMASSRRNGLWGAELKLLPPPEERAAPVIQLPKVFLEAGSVGTQPGAAP